MGEGKEIPEWAARVWLMREMGWDYWTYRQQPLWLLQQVSRFLATEAQAKRSFNHSRGGSR